MYTYVSIPTQLPISRYTLAWRILETAFLLIFLLPFVYIYSCFIFLELEVLLKRPFHTQAMLVIPPG